MNHFSIVYATKTGHSGKLAHAVGEALKISAENISHNPVPPAADLLFITGGIYGGESLPGLLEYVKKLDGSRIKRVALITSCTSGNKRQESVRRILEDKKIEIVDEFVCHGSFLWMKRGHPDKTELQRAVDFAVAVSKKTE